MGTRGKVFFLALRNFTTPTLPLWKFDSLIFRIIFYSFNFAHFNER